MPDFAYDWFVGYALGLLAIAIFAKERLNRRTTVTECGTARNKIIRLMLPGQMTRGFVFARAVIFYFLVLAMIYSVFAVFGSYLFPLLGESLLPEAMRDPSDPIWPVGIALIIVGLLPEIGPIARIEHKARRLSHWLIGVPKNFNDFADRLMQVDIKAEDIPEDLLDPFERQKLEDLLKRAEAALGSGNDYRVLEQNAVKLWCFREWHQKTPDWPSAHVRGECDVVTQHVTPIAMAVIEDLEMLPAMAETMDQSAQSVFRSRWQSVTERANRATDNICALFALFAEKADTKPTKKNPISAMLRVLIKRAEAEGNWRSAISDNLLMVMIIMTVASFVAGYYGYFHQELGIGQDRDDLAAIAREKLGQSFNFILRTAMVFMPVAALTFAVRFRANSKWVNAFRTAASGSGRHSFPTRQYLAHAILAGAIVFSLAASYAFYKQLDRHLEQHPDDGRMACVTWQFVGADPGKHRAACEALIGGDPFASTSYIATVWYSAHLAVVGSIVAVGLALVVDVVAARRSGWLHLSSIMVIQGVLVTLVFFIAASLLDFLQTAGELVSFEGGAFGLLSILLLGLTARKIPRATAPPSGAALEI